MRSIIAALSLLLSAAVAFPDDGKKVRVVMVGDSTMASYANPPKDRPDLTGWGQVFGDFFTDRVEVRNHAASGRSLPSFVKEGRWKKALDDKPDFVFIQFGHNDQKIKGEDGDPKTGYSANLRKYIDDVRMAGGKPILVTPVARRTFTNDKLVTSLQPFADAVIAVGKEKDVPVIDLHATSMELYSKLGDAGSADLTASKEDRTHFSKKGAIAVAGLVAKETKEKVADLKPLLK